MHAKKMQTEFAKQTSGMIKHASSVSHMYIWEYVVNGSKQKTCKLTERDTITMERIIRNIGGNDLVLTRITESK